MGVNRSTVREALHRLEASELVEIRQGGSTRVSDFLVKTSVALLPLLVAPRGVVDDKIIFDVLEIRTMLVSWTARLVARKGTPSPKLQSLVAEMEQSTDPTRLQQLDFDFFATLVQLTENRVLELLTHAVGRVYEQHRELFTELYQEFDLSLHRQALEAISTGDEERAAAAMSRYAERARSAQGIGER